MSVYNLVAMERVAATQPNKALANHNPQTKEANVYLERMQ
jgi:hypothetical protein